MASCAGRARCKIGNRCLRGGGDQRALDSIAETMGPTSDIDRDGKGTIVHVEKMGDCGFSWCSCRKADFSHRVRKADDNRMG